MNSPVPLPLCMLYPTISNTSVARAVAGVHLDFILVFGASDAAAAMARGRFGGHERASMRRELDLGKASIGREMKASLILRKRIPGSPRPTKPRSIPLETAS